MKRLDPQALRRRLQRLQQAGPEPEAEPASVARLRRYLGRPWLRSPERLAHRLGAVPTAGGRLLMLEHRFPVPARFLEHAELLTLGRYPAPLDLQEVVFLDIEATGTSFGLGNVPFLVALGFVRGGEGIVRQYLLPDPAHEPLLHRHLLRDLRAFPVVATYNGKSFDLRLLGYRWRYLGLSVPEFRFHLDVYHLARRFLMPGQPATLRAAEAELAGIHRGHDIPSEEVPRAYFAFLRRGVLEGLRRVVLHNRRDVASLPHLLHALDRRVYQGLEAPDPWTLFVLGRHHERLDRLEEARAFYERAAARSLGTLRRQALIRLGRLLQRLRRYDEAEQVWLRLLEEHPSHREALLSLAKYYEHRNENLYRALHLARQLPPGPERERRVKRLLRKIAQRRERDALQAATLLRE